MIIRHDDYDSVEELVEKMREFAPPPPALASKAAAGLEDGLIMPECQGDAESAAPARCPPCPVLAGGMR